MRKNLFVLLILLALASLLVACGPAEEPEAAPAEAEAEAPAEEAAEEAEAEMETMEVNKIAFFVSDLSNVFHQAQFAEAKAYAEEKYGVEVIAFDGKSDSAVMTENVDQVVAQGMDAATMQIWDAEAAKPGVLDALDKGLIMTSFFSPLADTGIPVARSDEAGISYAMGVEMAEQWKAAHPDKPIVMVQLGWPNHTEVSSGRTDPFVEGVLSVDPDAENLGCLDATKGPDAAKQIILDLVTQRPEVNLIYSEASNLTVGTMAGLAQAGRGVTDNGVPLTEIVASVDFDEVEMKQVYDPNSSLKLSMGLPPVETARGRIDLIMDIAAGKVDLTSDPAEEFFYKAYNVSYWTMAEADAVNWLNEQFGTSIEAPADEAAMETMEVNKIAFFVSDLSNVFHQAQFAEAKAYAEEKYGVEVIAFDGKSDSAVMTQNVDQVVAQGMDAATMQIWDAEAAKPGVMDALDKGLIMTSFFSPLADTGIPVARSDEAGISYAMGVEMAEQWKAAHPDKPIVMVQLGWPNHTEVSSGRTDPFVEGVLSVDPDAENLGCLDATKGPDAAKQIILDLVTQRPEVNLIYSEASNLTVGTMAGLAQAGRGVMEDGVPLTEIVASVDFDEVEYKQVYDPNSSLKLSMGLPPVETARGRIDLIMDIASGKVDLTSDPAEEFFYKAYNVSYWTMAEADAVNWLNEQFGTSIEAPADEAAMETMEVNKIAFFVSDLSNVFHQAQFAEAKAYAEEKYGVEVIAFDGKSDSAVMTQNVDQVVAQGMDAATMQIWDAEAAKPGVMDALDKGLIMTSFFSPLADTGIPVARSDEAGISYAMGVEMAEQWKAAHPDKPIVMVQLGWPNHTEVSSGRTDPFVEGVLSVDPDAENLGCLDATKGPDAAKQIILDLVTQRPEVNLIYSEASNLTVGTMAGLAQAGRGVMEDGVPLTEIVASVDFDEVEYKQVYDPNSSLKLSMGLPPVETARGRIDLIMDIASGKVSLTSDPAEEFFYKAYNVSFWTMTQEDAASWLNEQFGTNIE